MNRALGITRRSLAAFVVTVGLLTAAWPAATSVHAEDNQNDASHKQLCADLYLIYDTNMDTHYDKSKSQQERQQAYEDAQQALSDMRKQGCKTNVARVQQLGTLSGLDINVQEVGPAGSQVSPLAPATTAPHLAGLVAAR